MVSGFSFAPHHGRSSGKLPSDWLSAIDPKIIVIGGADSTMLDYYMGTILSLKTPQKI